MIYLSMCLDDLVPSPAVVRRRCAGSALQGRSNPGNVCFQVDHEDCTGPLLQHELDLTGSGLDLSALNDLDRELWGSIVRPRCEEGRSRETRAALACAVRYTSTW